MNLISSWLDGLGLRLKLQILIQGSLIVLLAGAQAWIAARFERQILEGAEQHARTVADGAINGLNTLMVTQVGGAAVIFDKPARALFVKKMGVADKIVEMRIVRGKNVESEFGPGLPQEQPVDETDRRVLASGKAEVALTRGDDGKALLRAVLPFVAAKDFRGTDCLQCHVAPEGSTLGAASVVIDVRDQIDAIRAMKAWLWAGQVALQLLVAAILYFVTRGVVRQLGGEPETAVGLARRVAQGDLTARLDLKPGDRCSLMASLQAMQAGLGRTVGDVRRNAESLATASEQMARGNTDLSGRTEEQAAALQETAASMEQLDVAVRRNADNAGQADRLARDASAVAAKGGEVVGEVVHTMQDINASSARIGDIVGVIDGIAFQTNILALNAAVEAARAGEQGRGFAVVASEVRSLAARSAEAAREIKGLIGTSVARVEQGTTLVDQARATMTEVVDAIKRVTDLMGAISADSSEQSQGVAQVREAVSQMDQVTQQNAALVEQSAGAAETLRLQARALVQAVAVFRLDREAG